MKLHYQNNLFTFSCSLVDNDLARRAGFAWDKINKVWVTPHASVAKKLSSIAKLDIRNAIKQAEMQEAVARMDSCATDTYIDVPVPGGLDLYAYQKAGIAFAASRENTLLADQMGLGKTPQAIGFCNLYRKEIQRVLIICPATLKGNWAYEWQRWSMLDLPVGVAYGSNIPRCRVCIVNYDILARHHAAFRGVNWDVVIVDECHYLKNTKAQRTKEVLGARGVAPISGRRKLFLTGTPILNRPIELYPVIKHLAPFAWPTKFEFAKRYCNLKKSRWGWDMSGASNLEELQHKLRSTIMVRRLKKDVLKELPDKVRQVIEIDIEKGKKKLLAKEADWFEKILSKPITDLAEQDYRDVIQQIQGSRVGFEEMSTVRRETALAKVPYVIDHLKEAIDSSGKVVCFVHHKEVAQAIQAAFSGECVVLTGETPSKRRQDIVNRFQNDKCVRLFIGNLQAAGVGITLTASSHVVFAEISWVPGEVSQAEDRCHRIGQKDSVLVQHLVLAGSVDATMAKTVVRKQSIIERAVDASGDEAISLAEMLR